MKVKLFADFTCPFSYMGKRILDQAIAESGVEVDYEFKAFQLSPEASTEVAIPTVELLAKKFGRSLLEIKATTEQIKARAHELGLDYNYETMKAANTLKAHRLTKWASSFGKANESAEAFFYGLFTSGANLNNEDELVQLIQQLGLDEQEAKNIISSDAFLSEVQQDRKEANSKGIQSVPTIIINGNQVISGVQPVNVLVQALKHAATIS